MSEEKEFLLMLINKELEEESNSCDDKQWIENLIKAKAWLLRQERPNKANDFIDAMDIQDDVNKYLKDN